MSPKYLQHVLPRRMKAMLYISQNQKSFIKAHEVSCISHNIDHLLSIQLTDICTGKVKAD